MIRPARASVLINLGQRQRRRCGILKRRLRWAVDAMVTERSDGMLALGFESSCGEIGAALVRDGREVVAKSLTSRRELGRVARGCEMMGVTMI